MKNIDIAILALENILESYDLHPSSIFIINQVIELLKSEDWRLLKK